MPETTAKYTWTKHVFACTGCSRRCYATQEAIDESRANCWWDEGTTDKDIGENFEFCLSCITGTEVEGERVLELPSGHRKTITSAESQQYIDGDNTWLRGAVWELRGLTPDDVRNLDAACGFLEDAPEEWGDTQTTLNKIVALVKAVKDAGVWPGPKPMRVRVYGVNQTTAQREGEERECWLSECFPGDVEEERRVHSELLRFGGIYVGGGAAQMFYIQTIEEAESDDALSDDDVDDGDYIAERVAERDDIPPTPFD